MKHHQLPVWPNIHQNDNPNVWKVFFCQFEIKRNWLDEILPAKIVTFSWIRHTSLDSGLEKKKLRKRKRGKQRNRWDERVREWVVWLNDTAHLSKQFSNMYNIKWAALNFHIVIEHFFLCFSVCFFFRFIIGHIFYYRKFRVAPKLFYIDANTIHSNNQSNHQKW